MFAQAVTLPDLGVTVPLEALIIVVLSTIGALVVAALGAYFAVMVVRSGLGYAAALMSGRSADPLEREVDLYDLEEDSDPIPF